MNISYGNSQPLTDQDRNELRRFEDRLESCIANGSLFFEDLENALKDSQANHKLTTQKVTIIRQIAWERIESGSLQVDWQPYGKR